MLDQLKEYAKVHHVPIISDDGLLFLKNLITNHHKKNVLEIGSAIGYSALAMASFGGNVTTIERDPKMASLARAHILLSPYQHQVKLIEADALNQIALNQQFDLLFIDGAKAQYQKFFEIYQSVLKPDGVIVCDNLNFHHLDPKKVNRHTRQLLRKIEKFKNYLADHPEFQTTFFFEIGDGISMSQRK